MNYNLRISRAQYRCSNAAMTFASASSSTRPSYRPSKPDNPDGGNGSSIFPDGTDNTTKNLYSNYMKQYNNLQKPSEKLQNMDFSLPTNEDGTVDQKASEKKIGEILTNVEDWVKSLNSTTDFLNNAASNIEVKAFQQEWVSVLEDSSKELEALGISVDNSGKVSVDKDKLNEALLKNAPDVGKKLAGTGNSSVIGKLNPLATKGMVVMAKISSSSILDSSQYGKNWWEYGSGSNGNYPKDTIGSLFDTII